MSEKRPRVFLIIAAASLLLTGIAALLVHPFNPDRVCCDHLAYQSMSYNLITVTRPDLNVPPPGNVAFDIAAKQKRTPSAFGQLFQIRYGLNHLAPYVYRVMTPLLARSIAYVTSIRVAYYLISFLALAAAALFTGLSIFELTGSEVPALAGVILFVVNPFTAKFYFWDYMLTDPMAFFLTALAIWALVTRKRFLFFAACAVGVLNKESMVPMVIAYPLTEAWVDHQVRRSSIAAAVGIVVGYYLFRVVMPEAPTGYTIINQFHTGLHHMKLMAAAGITVFGLMIPAALRRPWGSRLMISLAPFAVACVLAAWFVDDLERALVLALPAVCVAIFWLWPTDLRRQLLTLAVVPIVVLHMVIAQEFPGSAIFIRAFPDGVPHINFALLLAAVGAEIWLWRSGRDVLSSLERPKGRARSEFELRQT